MALQRTKLDFKLLHLILSFVLRLVSSHSLARKMHAEHTMYNCNVYLDELPVWCTNVWISYVSVALPVNMHRPTSCNLQVHQGHKVKVKGLVTSNVSTALKVMIKVNQGQDHK